MKLSVASWNINDIFHKPDLLNKEFKTADPEFKKYISKHDIIGISEIKVGKSDKINIEGYKTEQIFRKQSGNRRYFGGICIAIKDNIAGGTTVLRTKGESEYLWVRLDKYFFNLDRDYYICFVYVSPDKSGKGFGIEVYDRIVNSIANYVTKGHCMVFGDMNAHTSIEPDFIINDNAFDLSNLPDNYDPDVPLRRRNSDGSKLNEHAGALLELCRTSGLRILNGRKLGDMLGACTYFGPMCKNPTLIDYGLVHKDDYNDVTLFRVQDLCYLSDHCLIYAHLNVNPKKIKPVLKEDLNLSNIPARYKWENDRASIYLENISNRESVMKMNNILQTEYSGSRAGIDGLTQSVTNIFISAADKTFRKIQSLKSNKVKSKHGSHFDGDCKKMLRELKNMSRRVSRDPKNYELRKTFYYNKKLLKKNVKDKIKCEKDNLVKELATKSKDPKQFWKLLEKIQESTHGRKKEDNDVSASVWVHHFKELMCKSQKPSAEQQHVVDYINDQENWHIFNELSFKISKEEIKLAIKRLKLGKSCGEDQILNEMLKCGRDITLPIIYKLFNSVLQAGEYPTLWSGAWLKPLHKGGDTTDPNRYRGISIMSCMGKLFCTVLNSRLVKFLKSNNFNSDFQIGFSENCKTSDHILTLKTLTDKYFHKNKKLFVCFIDFRKAFDSVWRDALVYKLLNANVGGMFGRLIQNMYTHSSVQIKLNEGLTDAFQDNIGVKQGCVLSPTLFKLFINDLPSIFTDKCQPVSLFNRKVTSLLFADDVVLTSESKEGLQQALNELLTYSNTWKLNVNTDKSKIMVFNKSGKMFNDKFFLDKEALENVRAYNYLGITCVPSGIFSVAINNLDQKAKKAMFKIRNSLFKTNVSPKMCLHIFDTLVRPINTYCSDVWGAFLPNTHKIFDIMCNAYSLVDNPCFEKTDLRFIKSILGVHRKASNAAVRGELGRYPTIIYIIKQVVKNWLRISNYRKDSILYDTYLCNLQMVFEGKKCWLFNIRKIVYDTLGLKHLWENQGRYKKATGQIRQVVNNLKHIYEFQWRNEINRKPGNNKGSGNKLRTYALFKSSFKYETYLDFHPDFRKRRLLTKLRISSHRLEVEMGRYQSKTKVKKIVKDRVCNFCDAGAVEDEIHVLMDCSLYSSHRKDLLKHLFNIFPGLPDLDKIDQFKFIMQCRDYEVFNKLLNLLQSIVTLRGSL